jgi:FKBP-type peptidyl-prolyl cis-trans isomerase
MKKTALIIIIIILILTAFGVYVWLKPAPIKEETQSQNQEMPQSQNIQGMKIETLQEGSGEECKTGDAVVVNYVGTLEDGTKFDSSIDRGETFSFTLGENKVIQGWELGVLGMKTGEKRKLTIPPELGYGNQAIGNIIPANSTLIFEVDLVEIKN